MKVLKTDIKGLVVLEPRVFSDERGYFLETYNRTALREALGVDLNFVQDNESCSAKHTLRGLHFQMPPHQQGKLVRVVKGAVLDVAVDLRKGSSTFGHYHKEVLDADLKRQMWIPPGFAHGFLTLEDDTVFAYKCTGLYDRDAERSLRWDDPQLAIDWGVRAPLLSEKDAIAPLMRDFDSPFDLQTPEQ